MTRDERSVSSALGSRRIRGGVLARVLTLAGIAALSASCGGGGGSSVDATPGAIGGTPDTSAAIPTHEAVLESLPWSFSGTQGRVIRTASYEVYTTLGEGMIVERAPTFLERALFHYTTAMTPLPRPTRPMETYLLATRPQWVEMTQKLLGSDAGPYVQIERGGFSHRGRGVYFDIGPKDTFTIAAHEGWHQYAQSTFREGLPVWLDEGVATWMEGFRWDPEEPDKPAFKSWANLERYEMLRWTNWQRQLMPLEELLRVSPQDLVSDGKWRPLQYYAQVWALIHFLMEGNDGVHAPAVRAMLRDAATGTMTDTIREKLGRQAAETYRLRRDGRLAFAAYIGADLPTMETQFKSFVAKICARGGRQRVAQGQSPWLQ